MKHLITALITVSPLLFYPVRGTPEVPPGGTGPLGSPAPVSAPAAIQFGFDDLMSMLVQPRHLKLFNAGTQRNWELAALESRNLRAALAHVAATIPKYLQVDVAKATNTIILPKLDALDAAIATADPKKFQEAFRGVTEACNACHVYLERPYIQMKVPDASSFPDQEFKPSD